jgi:hypothetical protein
MAWWKWHQGGNQDLQDRIGPSTMHITQSAEPECQTGSAYTDEPVCESQLTPGLASELRNQGVSIPRSCVRIRVDK